MNILIEHIDRRLKCETLRQNQPPDAVEKDLILSEFASTRSKHEIHCIELEREISADDVRSEICSVGEVGTAVALMSFNWRRCTNWMIEPLCNRLLTF
jgi:hypothetical protein